MHFYTDWYIIQVSNGKEQTIQEVINRYYDKNIETKIFLRELIHTNSRESKKILKPVFPGYIFIKHRAREVVSKVRSLLKNEFIRVVCFKQKGICASCISGKSSCMVYPDEMAILLESTRHSGLFELSYAHHVNDNIEITQGPLRDLKGKIFYINRKKRKAGVEISLFNRTMQISLGLEFLSCINPGYNN